MTIGPPSLREIQRRVEAYWNETGVVARALAGRPGGPPFRFTEGPPTANGSPHLGHVVQRALKDIQLRYRRMKGYSIVSPMAGWDCHGLPVELQVEKELGFKSKREIEQYGVERFCAACRTMVEGASKRIEEMSRRLGFWLDYDRPYYTMSAPYIESVWWSVKTLYDRGLIEKDHYVLPYCPRCETPLSSHEVAQGYREATDPSVTVRFPLRGVHGPGRDLLVWTTTPWTLPMNLLVAARADFTYVIVREADGREVVLAETAVPRYFPGGAEIVGRLKGSELEGARYEPPFGFLPETPPRFRVVLDDSVVAEEGTGFVHTAPSFGPDDLRIGTREGVGAFDPLDSRGVFTDAIPLVAGRRFKEADPILTADLRARGRLWRAETIRHTYPFCWRCDSPLLYRAIDSWFVRTRQLTDRLVRHNATVDWIPAHLRDGRFGNFLTEAKDWAVSRNRYWGTPLPIWTCPAGHVSVIGSFAELAERSGATLPPSFDPHRVDVDRLPVRCATCGAVARREPYTLDTWYDSGSAPFAQYHYPFEPGPFDPTQPLDYVAEGLDQTRGWFYTLLVLAVALFDRPAYRRSLTTGLVLDETGGKLSKSKGAGGFEPNALLDRVGADVPRWMFASIDFTEPMRISEAVLQTHGTRFLLTVVHATQFYLDTARLAGFRLERDPPRPTPSRLLDRWLLSRLSGTAARVDAALERGDPRPATAALRTFVDDLSTWYLRRSRPRFWSDEPSDDRREAFATLGFVLDRLALLLAPFVPFTAEWVRLSLRGRATPTADESVHLAAWPADFGEVDRTVEEGIAEVRRLAEIAHALRATARVKSRIPLSELVLFGPPSAALAAVGPEGETLLADEANVRAVVHRPESERARHDDAQWVVREEDGRPIAALPRAPTPELAEAGLAREIVRRLQQARKEAGLSFGQEIELTVWATGDAHRALDRRRSEFEAELLARPLTIVEGPGPADAREGPPTALTRFEPRSWEVDGVRFAARLQPIPTAAAPSSAEPVPPVAPRQRRRRRTARAASTAPSRRPGARRPSRRRRRAARQRSTPVRRRPAAARAPTARRRRRSARPGQSRPPARAPARRHRRSRRAARGSRPRP